MPTGKTTSGVSGVIRTRSGSAGERNPDQLMPWEEEGISFEEWENNRVREQVDAARASTVDAWGSSTGVGRRGDVTNQSWNQDFGLLDQQPQYTIPQEIFDILDLYSGTSDMLLSNALGVRSDMASQWGQARSDILGKIGKSEEESLAIARGDVARIRDIQERSRQAQLKEVYDSRKNVLGTLEESGQAALDIARLRAFSGLPGADIYRSQIAADTAEAVNAIQQRAGAGGAALGAISQAYTGKTRALQDLAAQEAGYRATGMEQLGARQYEIGQQMAQAQRLTSQDVINVQRATGQDLSSSILAGSQYQTGLMGSYAGMYSNAVMGLTQGATSSDLAGSQMVANAMQTGANLRGSAMQNIANERKTQWQMNELAPYERKVNILTNLLYGSDPFQAAMSYYGDVAGMGYGTQMSGIQGQNYGFQSAMNALGQGVAGIGNLYYLNSIFNPPQPLATSPPVGTGTSYTPATTDAVTTQPTVDIPYDNSRNYTWSPW